MAQPAAAHRRSDAHLVLLVEDNPDHAELVKRALDDYQSTIQLRHLEDGAEALQYLRGEGRFADPQQFPHPRLVLLDIRLPKVDGLEVLRLVKSDAGLQHIPVVMLTTSSSSRDRIRAYQNHANSYLKKPVDFAQFHEMMASFARYWFAWNQTAD